MVLPGVTYLDIPAIRLEIQNLSQQGDLATITRAGSGSENPQTYIRKGSDI
ncbi:hypothetical protein FQN54_002147 [Arachnomyces sp. PD_36]|nr:hypothetical protein FQN54_002147 [Arachnomyces sp. PD_36]